MNLPCLRTRPALLLLVIPVLLPIGCSKPVKPEEKPPAPVEVIGARKLVFGEWTELLGTTQPLPDRIARISARVEGDVVSVLKDAQGLPVMEGQRIQKGAVIAQLDTSIINQQKKQAEVALELARLEVDRLEDLSRTSSSIAGLPPVSLPERQKARLALEDASSKLQVLKEQQQLFSLTSPIEGRLGMLQIVLGHLAAGMLVAEVVNLDEIDVLCFAPRSVAARLALDQEARIVIEKENGQLDPSAPRGKVVFIAVQAQPDTGNLAVKVRFPNPKERLRSNTVVHVEVLTSPEKERLGIPDSALMEDQNPPGVVLAYDVKPVLNKEKLKEEKIGTALKFRARLGVRDRRMQTVEIIGLENYPEGKNEVPALEEAVFIIKGAQGLEDNEPVKIQVEEEPEK